jgi:DNA-binding NarL/FixJ family response regulator
LIFGFLGQGPVDHAKVSFWNFLLGFLTRGALFMKLLLADDHTLFRDALVQYIERAEPAARVTLAKDFYEVMDLMKEDAQQDLVLLDLRMPGMNGMEGFREMRSSYPDVPVALMSGIAESHDVAAAIDMGASGFFPKTLSGKSLLRGVQLVLAGKKFIPVDQAEQAIMPSYYNDKKNPEKDDFKKTESEPSIHLTPRESEVLSYLGRGASNKEIASALDLQVVTVKLHVRGICRKLSAKNRTQAALRARELGLTA